MRFSSLFLPLALTTAAAAQDKGSELYNEAFSILSAIPMFDTRPNDDQITVLELHMDYDFGLERLRYTQAMDKLTPEQQKVLGILQEGASLGNVDSAFMLAEMNMYGNYSFPQNGSLAFQYYHQVAGLSPNATAYYNLGFIYATGLFGEVEIDQAKANLYYQFAFEQGDIRAAMVLGYRYMTGISVPYNCQKARFYYQYVADEFKKIYDAAPLGGPHLDTYNLRVADFQEGLYGKDVGDTESSLTRKSNRHEGILQSDVLSGEEYSIYDQLYYHAIKHYEGSYTRPRNFTKAYRHASLAYNDGIPELKRLQEWERFYLARCIYLKAHMHMRGEGVEQDLHEALKLLKEALAIYPQKSVYNDLVLIYGKGPEGIRDHSMAQHYLKNSSSSFFSSENLGYGSLAGQFGLNSGVFSSGTESFYHQANSFSQEDDDKCTRSIAYLKYFCEAFDRYSTSLEWSFFEMMEGRSQNALIGYSMAAEQGFEMAQSSAAFLMYQPPGILEDPPKIPKERREMAKVYLTRSSIAHNLDSTVLLGDMYFDDDEYDKAVDCYEAAEGRGSSQASFNLGWLYEVGHGVEQDFHLAKRHYDLALARHTKAYLAVQISLLRLRLRSLMNNIFGNKMVSVHGSDDQEKKRTWTDWMNLYQRVRGTAQSPSDYEMDVQSKLSPDLTEPQEDVILNDDIMLILFFACAFAMFWLVYVLQRRQLRRRLAEGMDPNVPNAQEPQIQVQFGFFAI